MTADTSMQTRIDKFETILPTLATRLEIGDVRMEIGNLKAEIGNLRAAIAETKSDIIKWLSGAIFAAVAILLSAMFFLAARIAPVSFQPQPIVIQIPALSAVQAAPAAGPVK